jgi:hypothetical protein
MHGTRIVGTPECCHCRFEVYLGQGSMLTVLFVGCVQVKGSLVLYDPLSHFSVFMLYDTVWVCTLILEIALIWFDLSFHNSNLIPLFLHFFVKSFCIILAHICTLSWPS